MSPGLLDDPALLWSHPLAAAVLGDSLHPGGTELTREMAGHARLRPGATVLDVGCGRGASAAALADLGLHVHGVDVSEANLDVAQGRAPACTFQVTDEALADVAGPFDAVLSECALCLTGDPSATLRRFHGLLRPGGALLLSDVTVEAPAAGFRSAAAFAACLGGAMPRAALLEAVASAGFDVAWSRDCRAELAALRNDVRDRIRIDALLEALGASDGPVARLVQEAEAAFEAGHVGYTAIVARA